ncbi:hypothetical protein HY838_01095 [Candidatus Azambacteria bacterium]|nr:hypothetical protein [Candidatus Azambacteria bacterium]
MNLDFLKGLVPCGTSYAPHACTVCDFFALAQNIINFMLFIFAPLATLMAIYIAFIFLLSGGSPAKITDAKEKLRLLVLGIFWVLGSWLVLNTVLNFAVDKSVFPWPWNRVVCEVAPPPVVQPPVSQPPGAGEGKFGGGGTEGTAGPEGTLTEQEARSTLQNSGITINKSACPTGVRYQDVSGGCTSLDGISASTIAQAIQLKNQCNCNFTITGGTELGHAAGAAGHSSRNKLDLGLNPALDQYIQNHSTYIGVRSDGALQYQTPNGTIYAKEGTHWDVKFPNL